MFENCLARVVVSLIGLSAIQVAQAASSDASIEVLRVRPNFYMISGAGENIGVQIGSEGVVLVDAGSQEAAAQVLAEIRKLADEPIRYILNTSADMDHVGGNAAMTNRGAASILAEETDVIPGHGRVYDQAHVVEDRDMVVILPGKNPFLDEVTKLHGIPLEAALGGAETMYPDFREKIKDKYVRPKKCVGTVADRAAEDGAATEQPF